MSCKLLRTRNSVSSVEQVGPSCYKLTFDRKRRTKSVSRDANGRITPIEKVYYSPYVCYLTKEAFRFHDLTFKKDSKAYQYDGKYLDFYLKDTGTMCGGFTSLSYSEQKNFYPLNKYYQRSVLCFYMVMDCPIDYVDYVKHYYRVPVRSVTEKDGKIRFIF